MHACGHCGLISTSLFPLAQYDRRDNFKEADEGRWHGTFLVAMKNSRQPNQRNGQAAEGSRQQQCWTAGPRKRPHDNWRYGNLAHAPHESTIRTGCGVSGERSPDRFLTFDASNERVQTSFGGRAASQCDFRRGWSPRRSHQTLKWKL